MRSKALLRTAILLLGATLTAWGLPACSGSSGGDAPPGASPDAAPDVVVGPNQVGMTAFVSAPPGGQGRAAFGAANAAGAASGSSSTSTTSGGSGSSRTVEETDIYRYDATTDRLYYLNSYRGLMIFDVSNIDAPRLVGRAPIFGDPVDMVVRGTSVAVIIGDWYGIDVDGSPFHGSVVRGYDATDPANIRPNGEAHLGGWVRDSRVVADPTSSSGVLYTVSEDYGWSYGWDSATGVYSSSTSASAVIVSSVAFGPSGVSLVQEQRYTGSTTCGYWYGPGIFNVTNESILLARSHEDTQAPADASSSCGNPPTRTDLAYLDITDPAGAIRPRGTITVSGVAEGWGADNGRWNLDFADKIHAHVIGCASPNGYCYGSSQDTYVLATADFSNPDAPVLASEKSIPSPGWGITARFDGTRMYLSPQSTSYTPATSDAGAESPVQIYDLSAPAAPSLVGQTAIPGSTWLFMPSGAQLFALGQQSTTAGSQVSLSYLDVTNASAPGVIGTATFGDGWAWTPAAGTFKAFIKDDTQGLVLLPFASWSWTSDSYVNGVQLIAFTPPASGSPGAIAASGTAHTKGWVERGIFVKNRLVSLSDLALAVIDYTDRANPKTVTELTLARNVVDATPLASTIAELSSDWWGNDQSTSTLRVRPLSDPEEATLEPDAPEVDIPGVDARVFHDSTGSLAYVVTKTCTSGAPDRCSAWTDHVQVVDESGASPVLRGAVTLPTPTNGYWYADWGWYGFWYYDWYNGSDIVQVGDHVLAFRRWQGWGGYTDAADALYVVDVSNPDAPTLASTTITTDTTAWWGNLHAIGTTLYASHYEWYTPSSSTGDDAGADGGADADADAAPATSSTPYVRYYLDRINLADPTHPVVESRINVPGVLVGAKDSDPSVLYTIDYSWTADGSWRNQLDVVQVQGNTATLLSTLALDGWVGRVITQNDRAYMSVENSGVNDAGQYFSQVRLHQIDMTDPAHPADVESGAQGGWGWLLDVEGDRAFVTSGWGSAGLDVYKLQSGAPPVFEQFVRTRGWSANALKRQGNNVYLSTGYWGVQAFTLQ